jgi:hypothetical protein
MATWEDVRRLAAGFEGAEESTVYTRPAFKVRGKSLAWMSPHEPGALVTRADPDEVPLLIGSNPDLYFTTPHYEGYAMVLTRLEQATQDDLRERIEDSYDVISGGSG